MFTKFGIIPCASVHHQMRFVSLHLAKSHLEYNPCNECMYTTTPFFSIQAEEPPAHLDMNEGMKLASVFVPFIAHEAKLIMYIDR